MNKKYHLVQSMAKKISKLFLITPVLFLSISQNTFAESNAIQDITFTSMPGNRVQLNIDFVHAAEKPLSFTIDNPARIAFDFNDTISQLEKRKIPIGVGIAQSVTTVTAKNKTRVILNLTQTVPYNVVTNNNRVTITLDSESTDTASSPSFSGNQTRFSSSEKAISKIDFRRGEKSEGRVMIDLTDASIPMDIKEEFGKIVVTFVNTSLPKDLHQRLDVLDFATPVKAIDSFTRDGNTRIEIEPSTRDFEHLAYQTNRTFIIELIPISKEDLEAAQKSKFGYTGERLSLNFQDIPVRAVLQLIADFTGLNVVVSDSVDGNLTLRLKNVPWDQALAIILKAKGLSKRESGNVILIAPSEEIAAQEKLDLEAQQQVVELSPIRTAFFTINFAKVSELKKMFEAEGGGEEEGATATLLSSRGSVIIDERTNTLIIKDTDEVISEVRRILNKLDIPIRQVLIESRIVIASDDFKKEMGVRFGANKVQSHGATGVDITSGTYNSTAISIGSALDNLGTTGNPFPVDITSSTDRLNVNMPVTGASGSVAFAVLTGGTLLDLELSALEAENDGEIISSPRVVTSDRHEAFIEQGVEIPYLSATSAGATQVEFKKAVLSIKVTPQITPDDRIIMDLQVNKDAVGQVFANIPSIDTREVTTQVLVNNGDTIVLGGIYETETRNELDKVPLLGDLPIIGSFFRHSLESIQKQELLIFVTPKILKESLSL
ncbi:MAG: type IV pilus secretin PilQ [Gammaproteobacteria bacterium]|nr:type IV pilus secretin PilQ [Gammaproteobacteria bacterium]